jgi:FKBP-type peptidyl-prolyl cis-trans isomerase (trigger factor)
MKSLKVIISLILLFSYFSVSAQYQKNIEDEYKIYLMEKKVSDALKLSNNPERLSQKYRNIIEKYLEKDTQENISSFKQYALKRIDVALQYDSFL